MEIGLILIIFLKNITWGLNFFFRNHELSIKLVIQYQFSEKWHSYFSSTLEQIVRVKDSDESASIEFGIGESFRNMDEMFETIEIGDQERDPRTSPIMKINVPTGCVQFRILHIPEKGRNKN